jgi:hypothetical protein
MIDCSKFTENGEPKWWVPYFLESEQLLLNALEYSNGTHSLEDVAMALDKDEMQFWPGINTALVTEVITHPNQKSIHIFLAAGDMDEVIRILPFVEIHGKLEGCTHMTMTGRKGWEKVMSKIYKVQPRIFLSTEI